jgi:membrane-associated phospholipid phosphatase
MHSILFNVEKPTGAFPSSHVGLAIILSYLAYKHHKKLFYITLPFVTGICFATVYLKEHYVIDVLAAFLIAPVFVYTGNFVYNRLLLLNIPEKQNR